MLNKRNLLTTGMLVLMSLANQNLVLAGGHGGSFGGSHMSFGSHPVSSMQSHAVSNAMHTNQLNQQSFKVPNKLALSHNSLNNQLSLNNHVQQMKGLNKPVSLNKPISNFNGSMNKSAFCKNWGLGGYGCWGNSGCGYGSFGCWPYLGGCGYGTYGCGYGYSCGYPYGCGYPSYSCSNYYCTPCCAVSYCQPVCYPTCLTTTVAVPVVETVTVTETLPTLSATAIPVVASTTTTVTGNVSETFVPPSPSASTQLPLMSVAAK